MAAYRLDETPDDDQNDAERLRPSAKGDAVPAAQGFTY
jgi:hypothetical protein